MNDVDAALIEARHGPRADQIQIGYSDSFCNLGSDCPAEMLIFINDSPMAGNLISITGAKASLESIYNFYF